MSFLKKLGVVSTKHGDRIYTAHIDDSSQIVDKAHDQIFEDVIDWINFLQKMYPVAVGRSTARTAHEWMRQTMSPEATVPTPYGVEEEEDEDEDEDEDELHFFSSFQPSVKEQNLFRHYGFY